MVSLQVSFLVTSFLLALGLRDVYGLGNDWSEDTLGCVAGAWRDFVYAAQEVFIGEFTAGQIHPATRLDTHSQPIPGQDQARYFEEISDIFTDHNQAIERNIYQDNEKNEILKKAVEKFCYELKFDCNFQFVPGSLHDAITNYYNLTKAREDIEFIPFYANIKKVEKMQEVKIADDDVKDKNPSDGENQ